MRPPPINHTPLHPLTLTFAFALPSTAYTSFRVWSTPIPIPVPVDGLDEIVDADDSEGIDDIVDVGVELEVAVELDACLECV